MRRTVGSVFLLALTCAAPSSSKIDLTDVSVFVCHHAFLQSFDPHLSDGPLRLSGISCAGAVSSSFSHAMLSPDGAAIANWTWSHPGALVVAPLDRPGEVSVPNKAAFRNFAGGSRGRGATLDAVAWASDSKSLWSVRQDIAGGGWATSGLTPIKVGLDGSVQDLPTLRHPAGPVDGLLWAGGNGLAVVQFGWRGDSYRPEREDKNPTLAMVDAATGKILEALPARDVAAFRNRTNMFGVNYAIDHADAVVLPDGRIRIVIRTAPWATTVDTEEGKRRAETVKHSGTWIVWTQGEAPREWTDSYSGEHDYAQAVLSPDGSKLLAIRPLQPKGTLIFDCDDCNVPPPTPVSGPVAELIDLATQRVLWSVPATANQFWSQRSRPAISPDGSFALIELPPQNNRRPIALLDMRNGAIVQMMAPSSVGSYPDNFGFIPNGGGAWLNVGNQVLRFTWKPLAN